VLPRGRVEVVTDVAVRRLTEAIPATGTTARVAYALPDGSMPAAGWPGVVVLHELLGLQPEILEVGDRFAERGWAAAIPDYLSTGFRAGCLVRALREASSGRPGRVTDGLVAATHALSRRPEVDAGRLAVIGFCLGGSFALLLGTTGVDGIKAVAANYGDVPADLAGSPPVVGSYGGRDRIFGRKAEVLRERLEACSVANDIRVYSEAGHSFMTTGSHPIASWIAVPMHLGYVADAADDAWGRVFAWLDTYVTPAGGR
jgi:carboxymethylenebutenolidase